MIRRSVRYAESAERGVSILDFAPDLGADYLALADEMLEPLGGEFDEARELAAHVRLSRQSAAPLRRGSPPRPRARYPSACIVR